MKYTNLALFDLDHTLIPGDSDLLWTNFLVAKKKIEEVNTRLSDRFFEEQNFPSLMKQAEFNSRVYKA